MGYNRILTREAKWWRYRSILTKEKKVHVYGFVDKKRHAAATYEEVKRNVEEDSFLTTVKRTGKSTKISSKKRKEYLKVKVPSILNSHVACFYLSYCRL